MASELVPISGPEVVEYSDIVRMAQDVVKGGLFPGVKTHEQAMTLFLVAQAEGLHPMTAMMRYNIIQNRPAMKAEAMLASFMARGGTVDWTEYTDEAVTGVFNSAGCPKGVAVRWTFEEAKKAGLTSNPSWLKYRRQMLKARVASDGVRMTDPAVNQGRYTPEEVSELEPREKVAPAEIVPPEAPEEDLTPVLEASITALQAGDPALRGFPKKGAGRSSREASGLTSPEDPKSPDEDAPQPAPISSTEALIREDLLKAAWDSIEEDERCVECNGELAGFVSKKGVPYCQCSMAHDLYLEYLDKGKSKQMAGTMTRNHTYRIVP